MAETKPRILVLIAVSMLLAFFSSSGLALSSNRVEGADATKIDVSSALAGTSQDKEKEPAEKPKKDPEKDKERHKPNDLPDPDPPAEPGGPKGPPPEIDPLDPPPRHEKNYPSRKP